MGFSNYDQIIDAWTVSLTGERMFFQKQVPSTNVSNIWHSLWEANGMPAAGGDATKGLAGAVVLTDADTGAIIPFTNAAGGTTKHLLSGWAMSATGGCIVQLVDQICHARLDRNQATGSFSPVLDATSRLASGEGGQLVMACNVALGTGTTTRTFDYTDQAGNSATTPNITDVASAVVGRILNTYPGHLWLPLAAGDTGVRTVTGTTLGTTGTATGEYHLAIVRPLATFTIPSTAFAGEKDFVLDLPNMPRLYDDSCLALYFMSNSASASFAISGELRSAAK